MRKMILLLLFLFSLGISADDNIKGCFIVAPILVDDYAAYGDCLAPSEMANTEASYVTGTYVTIINAQTTTDIKGVSAVSDKSYYSLQGDWLKVYSPANLYSLDGKRICGIKTDAQIGFSTLPDIFIVKFIDGPTYKLQKCK